MGVPVEDALRLRGGGGWGTLAWGCRRVDSDVRVEGKLRDGKRSHYGVRRLGADVVAQRVQGVHEIYRDAEETHPSLLRFFRLVEVKCRG